MDIVFVAVRAEVKLNRRFGCTNCVYAVTPKRMRAVYCLCGVHSATLFLLCTSYSLWVLFDAESGTDIDVNPSVWCNLCSVITSLLLKFTPTPHGVSTCAHGSKAGAKCLVCLRIQALCVCVARCVFISESTISFVDRHRLSRARLCALSRPSGSL